MIFEQEPLAMSDPIITQFVNTLPQISGQHAPGSELYGLLQNVLQQEAQRLFSSVSGEVQSFEPFGGLSFSFRRMGSVTTLNLFELDEMILFSFYYKNRNKYKRVADIGGNVGLHSFVLNRCGYDVSCYEPDPQHYAWLCDTLNRNNCTSVKAYNSAVSSKSGELEFVRVIGNTTSSHLAGSKESPYGPLERFPVKVEAIKAIIDWADFLKIDAEGHEKEILLATSKDDWVDTDAMVEVSGDKNAEAIYNHFNKLGVFLFSQKTNWQRVRQPSEMPTSHHDGSLFITAQDRMVW